MSSTLCQLNVSDLDARLSGLQMYVHDKGDLHVSKALQESGVWEAYETQLIYELLEPGDSFIDVGANIGYYTLLAAKLVGLQGRVVAFEPEQRNFALLSANVALLDDAEQSVVVLENAGLSHENAQAEIYLSDDNFGDHQIYDAGLSRQASSITLLKGADYLRKLDSPIKRINVLKIDTQGAEMKVMAGLKDVIQNSLPDINIIIEFWPFGLRQAGDHGHQLLDYLLSLNLPVSSVSGVSSLFS